MKANHLQARQDGKACVLATAFDATKFHSARYKKEGDWHVLFDCEADLTQQISSTAAAVALNEKLGYEIRKKQSPIFAQACKHVPNMGQE